MLVTTGRTEEMLTTADLLSNSIRLTLVISGNFPSDINNTVTQLAWQALFRLESGLD